MWQEIQSFASGVPVGALLLDAGSGSGPYKSLFAHAIYESADFEQVDKHYQASTYVCDLKTIPVDDSRFDFIIFNQVLEHLPEPVLVLKEMRRVLKPGAVILCTAPFFYEEHEQPYDFFRYTQFGLRHLFESTGYIIERMDWLEGYYATSAYQLGLMARRLPCRPVRGIWGYLFAPLAIALKVTFLICSFLFHRIEPFNKHTTTGYPKNYIVLTRKPF